MPVILAHAIEDSTDIFGISGGSLNTPNPPLGTPLQVASCISTVATRNQLLPTQTGFTVFTVEKSVWKKPKD